MAITQSVWGLTALAASAAALYVNGSVTAPCDSPIYCHGELLKAIQLAAPYSDSKTFVDLYVFFGNEFRLTRLTFHPGPRSSL